jgi:hypothetical protein
VRILILFHLPLTLFSVYQWTIRDVASLASVILSALSFAVFSVLLPIYLLIQVSTTPTAKLYDAMRTLLSLGPLYNIYAQGNQLYQALRFTASLATGIAIGAGQNNGTAQARSCCWSLRSLLACSRQSGSLGDQVLVWSFLDSYSPFSESYQQSC